MTKTRMVSITVMAIGIGLVTTPAFALEVPPMPIPEPTALTLLATGVAGLLISARFIRRK